MRKFLVLNTLLMLLMVFFLFSATSNSEDETTCPQKCVESRKNCDLSCSQIVGGGAKSRERRECVKECGGERELCNDRCVNPTPRPTLKPEPYQNKSCANSCEFKAKDCNQQCTKYTGGGAKSGKKAVCRQNCTEGLSNCKNWCVNPTPKPTMRPNLLDDKPCPEVCEIKNFNCETNCTSYIGGGAKSEKRSICMNDCRVENDNCTNQCSE